MIDYSRELEALTRYCRANRVRIVATPLGATLEGYDWPKWAVYGLDRLGNLWIRCEECGGSTMHRPSCSEVAA